MESSTTAHLFQTGWKRSSHTPVFQLTGQQGIEAFVTKIIKTHKQVTFFLLFKMISLLLLDIHYCSNVWGQ